MRTLNRLGVMLVAALTLLMSFTRTAAAEVATRAGFAIGHCYAAVDYGFRAVQGAFDRLLLASGMHVALLQAGFLNLSGKRLAEILAEMKKLQDEYAGKEMPAEIGKKWDELSAEGEQLQASADREKKFRSLEDFGREIGDVPLPADRGEKARDGDIAGYLSLGEAVVNSPAYKQFVEANFPKGSFPLLVVPELKRFRGGAAFMPLTRKQREEWEAKAVPTIGTGVLDPQRIADIAQVTAPDKTVLRDVLNVSRTNANAVEYVREDSYTRAADTVAHGAAKPQAAAVYSLQTATVRTIAVWIPATVQMLADWPALRNLIDNRLLWDLRKVEEEQVMYGGGTGQDFAGIVPNAGTDIDDVDGRVSGATNIDRVRIGMTEVLSAGYEPNALVLHPADWEGIVLAKGSDAHYLSQVFPSQDGQLRLWGLQVVETVAAQANAGVATEARNLVVGDFRRGATLWIREDASVMVGMQNDDFTKNLRTILAEERAAFAVTAPDAFAVYETRASAT